MEDQKLKEEIQKKLDDRDIVAVESVGILTTKDVLTAIDVIDALDTDRDETEEWNHIKKLQRERSERLTGSNPN